ncbi:hypothetical protein BKA67DRAFT_541747 [Truncatella angustata]|uniref:Uncharacterized protein n=1 Tax=Truncatella angustata TaxID=152316 RepID=A0A9P8RLX7_9PEZI|nr:uncharacterized protein BKA67DRAFT_541747 [Truncatella angustata]KAH6645536.1 hypothetical protein BKA67DRAFT_541747 [Truncatella angustata]
MTIEVANMGPLSNCALTVVANLEKPSIEAHMKAAEREKNKKLIALELSKIVRANGTFRTSPSNDTKIKTFPTMINACTEGNAFSTVVAEFDPNDSVTNVVNASDPLRGRS